MSRAKMGKKWGKEERRLTPLLGLFLYPYPDLLVIAREQNVGYSELLFSQTFFSQISARQRMRFREGENGKRELRVHDREAIVTVT